MEIKNHFFIIFVLSFLIGCTMVSKEANNKGGSLNLGEMDKQLRHVVLFKFKSASSDSEIQKIESEFNHLSFKISEIKAMEWGTNISPENLDKGFTHCFFLTFSSEKDRDIYLEHPAHLKFVEILGPHLEDVLVMDYWN